MDPEALRRRLQESFGGEAMAAAERRVRHRPWWRGGGMGWARPCTFLLAKRAFDMTAGLAKRQGEAGAGPEHLLYGVLGDALDPVGTQVSRKGRRQLAEYGWRPGRPTGLVE
ncbi:hypothetical protein AB0J63_42365 [Streptosporangium canum]|uniref:hypothetical protein n=1 Tax=Streptosporangium canum TaxID=324952 RepID=UPI003419D81F